MKDDIAWNFVTINMFCISMQRANIKDSIQEKTYSLIKDKKLNFALWLHKID